MLHPIFKALLAHPELVADHLGNYAALARDESAQALRRWRASAIAGVVALGSGLLTLGFAGAAVMLGVLLERFHWVLVGVPATTLVIALVAARMAARDKRTGDFAEFRAQLDADVQALHLARNDAS